MALSGNHRSSRDPENLDQKFDIVSESECAKYVPKGESTLVLNFTQHWFRSAENRRSKRFSPFKNSLKEQFDLMGYELRRTHKLLRFIHNTLYTGKSMQTLWFSHPSFIKTVYNDEDEIPRELNNVAIRITKDVDGKDNPLRNHDLILMGDIMHVDDPKVSRTEFVVKGIAMLNKASHRGEVKCTCSVICRVYNGEMEGFYTEEGKLGYNAPRQVYEKTVLNDRLIRELNETYIVQDYTEVLEKLNNWADFLKSEKDEADVNELRGYSIEQPQFFTAVPVKKGNDPGKDVYLETADNYWIDSTGSGSKAHLLVKITHNIEPQLFENDDKYVEKFSNLTALGVRVMDPASVLAENRSSLDGKELRKSLKMMAIGNVRLSPPILEGPFANEAARPLIDWKKRELKEIRNRFREKLKTAVDEALAGYSLTEEESATLDADLVLRGEEITSRAVSLRDRDIDSLTEQRKDAILPLKNKLDEALGTDCDSLTQEEISEKLPADLANVFEEYSSKRRECRRSVIAEELPLDDYMERARESVRNESLGSLLSDRRKETERQVRESLSGEMEAETKKVEKEFRTQLLSLCQDGEKSRLTVYYDIELPPTTNPYSERDEREKFFKRSAQYKLVYDSAGAQAALERQSDALNSFMNGEVSNPFLASYLFSTENGKTAESVPIGHYFGTMFNETQKRAITEAVNSDGIYLIQGPPGTGKTQVISEITMQMIIRGKKVMITSQNNKAIDNAFGKLPNSPLIRSVRLMAKGKDSEFDINSLVENYYRSLAEMLEKQHDLILSPTLLEALSRDGKRLGELYDTYLDCRKNAEKAIDLVETDSKALIQAQMKHEKGLMDSRSNAAKIQQIESELERIDYFEKTSYNKHKAEILALFPSIQVHERVKRNSEDYRAGKVFGRTGYCSSLLSFSDEEFEEQMDFIRDNTEYVNNYGRLCREGAGDDKLLAQLTDRLDQIKTEKEIDASQLRLLECFGGDLPRDPASIRNALKKIRSNVTANLRKRLKYARETQDKDFNAEKSQKLIDSIKMDLEDDYASPKYKAYIEAETELRIHVQKLFNELNLADKFESLDDAFSIIDSKIRDILSMSDEERANLAGMYEKSARHLRRNGIDNVMHDEILSHLKNYVNVVGMTCTADGRPVTEAEESDNRKNFDYWSKLGVSEDSSKDSKLVQAQEELEEKNYRDEDRALLDATTMGIDVVIVDEVSKVPFCELLRPIMAGKTVILVGDHKQLPPMYVERYDKESMPEDDPRMVREKEFAKMYTEPLFETLYEKSPETSKTMLNTQYRMAEQIMGAINRFYDGQLVAGCRPEDKVHRFDISSGEKKLIDGSNSVLFIDCRGKNVLQQGSTSFENPEEAAVVTKIVKLLEKNCRYTADGSEELQPRTPDYMKMSMGVITPYSAQVRLIRSQLDMYYDGLRKNGQSSAFKVMGEERFMIRSVDDFQGDERDVIILSLVRTTRSNFISDFRRLNVAMSRARRLLIIVGNAETLEKQDIVVNRDGEPQPVYKEIIDDIREHGGYLTADDILEAD